MNLLPFIETLSREDKDRFLAVQSFLSHGGSPSLAMVHEFLTKHHLTPHMVCPARYPRPEPLTPNESPTITNMRAVGLVKEDMPVDFLLPERTAGVSLNERQAVYQSQKDSLIYPVNPTRDQMEELKAKRMAKQDEIRLEDIPF